MNFRNLVDLVFYCQTKLLENGPNDEESDVDLDFAITTMKYLRSNKNGLRFHSIKFDIGGWGTRRKRYSPAWYEQRTKGHSPEKKIVLLGGKKLEYHKHVIDENVQSRPPYNILPRMETLVL